ncbi:hypothetical protein, partial [Bradyrhizobium genomosp. III]|uniref:hypothetical protein n=1 Tax=Bradyrhizobium genomosp. III TaxID=2683271 RepID=UPI0005760608
MSEKFEKQSEVMTSEVALREASNLLRELAGKGQPGESVKTVLHRLSRKLSGWNPSRIKDVWYADNRVCIRGVELQQLRALARPVVETVRDNDLDELRNRIARLERILETTDPAFHRETIAAYRDLGREMG